MARVLHYECESVLSDLEEDDPIPIMFNNHSHENDISDERFRQVLAELYREKKAREDLERSNDRLKLFAHEATKKREEALKEKEEALRLKDDAIRAKDLLRSEIEVTSQILVSGIDKINGKVKNLSSVELRKSPKYSGFTDVAYGVIKRTNDIVEDLLNQIGTTTKSIEKRNYEIAIEVSQFEDTISGLREEVAKRVNEKNSKLMFLQSKIDAQRPLLKEQLSYLSKMQQQVFSVIEIIDPNERGKSEVSDFLSFNREMDMEENLRDSLAGMEYIYELTKITAKKVHDEMEKRMRETKGLNDKVAQLVEEKQHVGSLLRSGLSRKFAMDSSIVMSEVIQVVENGLGEGGLNIKLSNDFGNGDNTGSPEKGDAEEVEQDEVYTLAGTLENIVRASRLEITKLQHSVDELRAESSLLKARVEVQVKELSEIECHTEELKEKERLANENVEGLMMDITAAEEEITRWKVAAEQEAAAGRAAELDFISQLSALLQELDEAKEAMLESEKKLRLKEDTATAAMVMKDAAEKSLRLADLRNSKLSESLKDLSRQVESVTQNDLRNQNRQRYVCWPWQWLALNFVGDHPAETQKNLNERELSEPLI